MKVGMIQQQCQEDGSANLAATVAAIREAAREGAELVLLCELHGSRYFCQREDPANFDLAESIPGPTTERLSALAAELGLVIVASLFERRAAGLYHNTAVVLERDGTIAGCYRKMHVPDDPGYYEKFYFTPGDQGFLPIDTSLGRLGVLICWDQWFPEAARMMALSGAELLLYPTAIGWDPADHSAEQQRQLDAWITVQRSHAISNGVPLLACNRIGFEPDPEGRSGGIRFWGNSFACGPQGEILVQGSSDREEVLIARIDPGRCEQVRRIWPFLRDRRIDAYQDLLRRYRDGNHPDRP